MSPRVSVIIPVFNRRKELKRALTSVLSQSSPPEEVLVIDDASTENITSVASSFDRTRVIRNQTNRGAPFSRNLGVESAQSDWVAFLDSDDFWHPNKLREQMESIEAEPELDVVYCDQILVSPDGQHSPSGKKLYETEIFSKIIDEFWTAPNTSTLLFKRKSFLNLKGFDESLSSCQDHDLWMRVGLESLRIKAIPKELSYFCSDGSDRISLHPERRMRGVRQLLEKWKEKIIERKGERAFKTFKDRYLFQASFPITKNLLRSNRALKASLVFTQNLAANPIFYSELKRKLFS